MRGKTENFVQVLLGLSNEPASNFRAVVIFTTRSMISLVHTLKLTRWPFCRFFFLGERNAERLLDRDVRSAVVLFPDDDKQQQLPAQSAAPAWRFQADDNQLSNTRQSKSQFTIPLGKKRFPSFPRIPAAFVFVRRPDTALMAC